MLSPGAELRVEQVPKFRALGPGVPAVSGGAQRKHPLFGAAFFLIAARAADRGVDAVAVERLLERERLHHVGVERRAGRDRVDAVSYALLVDMHGEVDAEPFRGGVAERDHVAELPGRIDVEQRKRQAARAECLDRKVQQHARILADRVKDGRAFEFGRGFAQDVNGFGLQPREMRRKAASGRGRRRLIQRCGLRHGRTLGLPGRKVQPGGERYLRRLYSTAGGEIM